MNNKITFLSFALFALLFLNTTPSFSKNYDNGKKVIISTLRIDLTSPPYILQILNPNKHFLAEDFWGRDAYNTNAKIFDDECFNPSYENRDMQQLIMEMKKAIAEYGFYIQICDINRGSDRKIVSVNIKKVSYVNYASLYSQTSLNNISKQLAQLILIETGVSYDLTNLKYDFSNLPN